LRRWRDDFESSLESVWVRHGWVCERGQAMREWASRRDEEDTRSEFE
jgi:hypothetical protein